MFDRKHIERLLAINGVLPTASDDEIREALFGAHYREDEATLALAVLRESSVVSQKSDGAEKLVHTDGVLNPKEISALLGIDVSVKPLSRPDTRREQVSLSSAHHLVIWLLAIAASLTGVVLAMYLLEFGIFHPTTAGFMYEWGD